VVQKTGDRPRCPLADAAGAEPVMCFSVVFRFDTRVRVAALTSEHVQQRDDRWCIVDLKGKHGRIRTMPMPTWVKVAIDAWTSAAGVADGYIFRPVIRPCFPERSMMHHLPSRC
jgi:integrase